MTEDLTQRLMDDTIGALELLAVHIGRELGLYEALDRHGPSTPAELAAQARIDGRYAREWLEQQAVAGVLHVAGESGAGHGDPDPRRFALPAAHRGALVDPIDSDHLAPFAGMVVAIADVIDEVIEAYRTGGGVPYTRYGPVFRRGQGDINRPAFSTDLVKAWLPAVAGVAERLASGGRLVDVGTGPGEASIAEARRHADGAGVDARFVTVDPAGTGVGELGPVDVALVLEALHDMSDPVGVLRSIRAALVSGGIAVVADEAVAEHFTAPGDELERMMYGWSVTHCLPVARADQPSAAIGTAIRPGTVADLAARAGFARCSVVDVDAGFFRIYRLAA